MSAAAPVNTRRLLETRLIEKAWKDPEFRKEVVRDPKGMLEKHLGQKLPEHLKIFIHVEDSSTLHFSVPPAPARVSELSDEELERVAGGTDVVITALVSVAAASASVGAAAGVTKTQLGW